MIVYDKGFSAAKAPRNPRRAQGRSRVHSASDVQAAREYLKANGFSDCNATCYSDFTGSLEVAKARYVVARSQHDIAAARAKQTGVVRQRNFQEYQSYQGFGFVSTTIDLYGNTWERTKDSPDAASWWWKIPAYGITCNRYESVESCYPRHAALIEQHHKDEARIIASQEEARRVWEAGQAQRDAIAAAIAASGPMKPNLVEKKAWGQTWWEADGRECGGAGNTVAYSKEDCQRRVDWCWDNHQKLFRECFHKCGITNSHPWTEEGGGCRQLPLAPGQELTPIRRLASTATDVGNALKPPELSELDPEVLCMMFFNNPIRYAAIITWSQVLVGTGAIVPWMIAQMVGKHADLKETLEAALVFFISPVLPVLVPLGIKQAVKRGGWDRAWTNILGPLVDLAGDALQIVIAYLTGGPMAAAAAGIRFVAKRLKGIPPIVTACLFAIADAFGLVMNVITKGVSYLTEADFWSGLGSAIYNATAYITGAPGDVLLFIQNLGLSLKMYANCISHLLHGRFNDAINEVCIQVLGVDVATLMKMGAADKSRLINPKNNAIDLLKAVEVIIKHIGDALLNVAKFLTINPLIDMIGGIVAKVRDFVLQALSFVGINAPKPMQPGMQPLSPEQLAAIIADREKTIRDLENRLAVAEAATQKEAQSRMASETALAVRSNEAKVLASKLSAAETERQRQLAAQQAEAARLAAEAKKQGGTALTIAAAAAAAFLT